MVRHKSFLLCLVLCLLFNIKCLRVFALEEYVVADVANGTKEVIADFTNYADANNYYLNHLDDYGNLVLYQNDTVLKMEYGIVEFVSNNACTLNIEYTSSRRNDTTSINACYGKDGAYLYSNNNADTVYFKLADDVGYTSFEDVTLHPIDVLSVKTSSYKSVDGILYHQIKTQLDLDYYTYVYALDKSPSYLEDDIIYYSYDGHYFYKDFKTMIDDYLNDGYENAINFDNPYYNYYEYLPFHSLTNYDYKTVDDYFNDVLKIKGKLNYYDDQSKDGANDVVNRSQYYDEIYSFFNSQNMYGTNAMLVLSLSRLESNDGKSLASYVSNNVFNVSAYNINEKENNRYESVNDSISAYAKYYINNRYCNYLNSKYVGGFLGNKYSGINSNYALDPYWGEKVAGNYFNLDSALDFKDYQSYCLGIIYSGDLDFYDDKNLSALKYSLKNVHDYSLIILEECENSYKVQMDANFYDDYLYDFESSIAYVDKEKVDLLFNKDNIHGNNLIDVTYDFDGGNIDGYTNLKLKVLDNDSLLLKPSKDAYVFSYYKKEENDNEILYTAVYKEIEKIKVYNLPSKISANSYLNIENAYIKVFYKDGGSDKLPIDTDMLSCVYFKDVGKYKIKINYHGKVVEQEIEVVEKDNTLEELIDINISSYKDSGSYNLDEIKKVKELLIDNDYDFDFEKIRILDTILLNEYHDTFNYLITENDYDLSLSGLGLSVIKDKNSSLITPFIDTYKVKIKNISSSDKKKLREIGEAYGFEPVTYFKVDYFLNGIKVKQNGPMIFSLKLEDKKTDKIYTVYRLDENGDIYKCKTIQSSNYISFLSKENGKFVVLEKDGFNNYDLEDTYENLTSLNDDIDTYRLFMEGMLMVMLIIFGFMNILYVLYLDKETNKLMFDCKRIFNEKIR